MLTQPHVPVSTPERFDGNHVECTGVVAKIWSHTGGDVFARLAPGDPSPEADENAAIRLTVKFPNGQFQGRDISLLKGDALHIGGFLSDVSQIETLRDFLLKARQIDLFEKLPELQPSAGSQVRRAMTYVIPESLAFLETTQGFPQINTARIEGVVARVWLYGGHLFARVAVYDRHTELTAEMGNNGRQRRIPHYVTVQFTDEQVNGRTVSLKTKDRVRVSGVLGSRIYSENLRGFLLSAHQGDVLATLSNGDAAEDVWTSYAQTCVVAHHLIAYTKR